MFILYILIEFCDVKQSLNIQSVTGEQLDIHELNSLIGFPSGRRTSFLHSIILHFHCCIALCKPAATELKSKNTHGYHWCNGVFTRIRFLIFSFDLSFDFHLIWIVTWQDKGDFRRILVWGQVWGQVWGEIVYPHTYPHHWNSDKQGVSATCVRVWG